MQFAVSLVPRSHCEVAIPCSPRGSSSAPAAGRRTACPPQVRALRLLPPHWGWRPRSPRFIVFPEKGRTLPLPPANGEPRPARVDLPPPLPQAVGRIAHRRCGVPTAGACAALTPPTLGLAPSQSAIYSVSGKGKNPSVAAGKWGTPSSPCRLAPAPAAGSGADCSPQVRRAHRRCGLPRPGTDPASAKKWPCVLQSHCFRFFKSLPARCFRKSAGRLAASCAPGGGAPAGRRSSDGDRSWRTRTYRGSRRR